MLTEACDSLWALSALRVAVENGVLAALAERARTANDLAGGGRLHVPTLARTLDVLVAFGLLSREGERFALTDAGRALADRGDELRADLAVTFGRTRAFVDGARSGLLGRGWRYADAEVIRGQAALSYGLTMRMMRPMSETWPDVGALFERDGATFLDCGVGGAGGLIAFCKLFPRLRAVGVDALPAAMLEARATVAAHGLEDRVELRAQLVETLTDERAFDVAFVPAHYMSDEAVEGTLQMLARALKPDGAVLLGAWRQAGDPRASSVSCLRAELGGAGPRSADATRGMCERAGFRNVRIGPAPGAMVPIVARR